MNKVEIEDFENICDAGFIPWAKLEGKRIFVTGGTGLVCSNLIKALYTANRKKNLNIEIIILVRDKEKAKKIFGEIITSNTVKLVVGDIETHTFEEEGIDYIIHGASITSSKMFVEHPVEIIDVALKGTQKVLEMAKKNDVDGIVYLSSMEVYGYPDRGHKVIENDKCSISSLIPRNSYPMSKAMCEAMCCAYSSEYGVKAKIVRLTQTLGAGVNLEDKRIFAYLANCMYKKENIVLKTKGETERSYLYTADAVTAILLVMMNGESGEAYNAADEDTYCSIAKMSESLADSAGIEVKYVLQQDNKNGYLNTLYMDLDTTKIKRLGWRKLYRNMDLNTYYNRMILSYIQSGR